MSPGRIPPARRPAAGGLAGGAALALIAVTALGGPIPELTAQQVVWPTCPPQEPCPDPRSSWSEDPSGHLAVLAANVLAGGLTAGIGQWRGDGSFWQGFWRGGFGGGATYLGKRMVSREGPAPALAGRALAAAGSSVSRNVADGRPALERLVLPLGPVRFHLRPREGTAHVSLDLFTVGAIVYPYLSSMDASLDLRQTLYAGAPVFTVSDWEPERGWHGRHVGGAILVRGDDVDPGFHRLILAHERVHLVQYDQAHILWGDTMDGFVLSRVGAGDRLGGRVDLSLLSILISASNLVIPYDWRPWELEADILVKALPP